MLLSALQSGVQHIAKLGNPPFKHHSDHQGLCCNQGELSSLQEGYGSRATGTGDLEGNSALWHGAACYHFRCPDQYSHGMVPHVITFDALLMEEQSA